MVLECHPRFLNNPKLDPAGQCCSSQLIPYCLSFGSQRTQSGFGHDQTGRLATTCQSKNGKGNHSKSIWVAITECCQIRINVWVCINRFDTPGKCHCLQLKQHLEIVQPVFLNNCLQIIINWLIPWYLSLSNFLEILESSPEEQTSKHPGRQHHTQGIISLGMQRETYPERQVRFNLQQTSSTDRNNNLILLWLL